MISPGDSPATILFLYFILVVPVEASTKKTTVTVVPYSVVCSDWAPSIRDRAGRCPSCGVRGRAKSGAVKKGEGAVVNDEAKLHDNVALRLAFQR